MDLKKVVGNIKRMGKHQILILFLCGVLLMIIAIPVKEKENQEISQNISGSDSTQYVKYLEQELEQNLSQMEGAGKVVCMVTLAQSAEQIIEKDMDISDENITESDSQGGTRTTSQSSRTETTIYDDEKSGEPYVSKEIAPRIEGVLVIAEGGDNAVVVKNITDSLQALFGIESHKIRIVKKGG